MSSAKFLSQPVPPDYLMAIGLILGMIGWLVAELWWMIGGSILFLMAVLSIPSSREGTNQESCEKCPTAHEPPIRRVFPRKTFCFVMAHMLYALALSFLILFYGVTVVTAMLTLGFIVMSAYHCINVGKGCTGAMWGEGRPDDPTAPGRP